VDEEIKNISVGGHFVGWLKKKILMYLQGSTCRGLRSFESFGVSPNPRRIQSNLLPVRAYYVRTTTLEPTRLPEA
jgi:hypothetical protein